MFATLSLAPIARPTIQAARPLMDRRMITNLSKVLYTAHAETSSGGRNGITKLREGGPLELKLAIPKAMGGSGDGYNPEQLFAMGYSACFLSAMGAVARAEGLKVPENTEVHGDVSIGSPEGAQGFALAVQLHVRSKSGDKEQLKRIVDLAEKKCPYSNAVRGNVPVSVNVD